MDRILVCVSDPNDVEAVHRRRILGVAEGHEMAICYVSPRATITLAESLDAQRLITVGLRRLLGDLAEAIPVFVVTDAEGDRCADCAKAWGATEVYR